jgi:hypothetical protein
MKKMDVFRAKPLWESIFAVRYWINSKGKIQIQKMVDRKGRRDYHRGLLPF